MLGWLKKRVYKRGYRPKYGSLLYSPSLAMMYAFGEAFDEGFDAGLNSPEVAKASEKLRYLGVREMVIQAGPFPSLAAAAAYEGTLRHQHGLEADYFELDGPLWPKRESIYWAVVEEARPRDASFGL